MGKGTEDQSHSLGLDWTEQRRWGIVKGQQLGCDNWEIPFSQIEEKGKTNRVGGKCRVLVQKNQF